MKASCRITGVKFLWTIIPDLLDKLYFFMRTFSIQVPSEITLKLGNGDDSESSHSLNFLEYSPVPSKGEVIAWQLPSDGLIGISLCDKHIAFYREQFRQLSLWLIYPAKGTGSVSMALEPITGDWLRELVVSYNYQETTEQWFTSILDPLAHFWGIPSGDPLEAHDC